MSAALDASTASAARERELGNTDAAELHEDMASSLPRALTEFPMGNHGPADHPDPSTGHATSGKGGSVAP